MQIRPVTCDELLAHGSALFVEHHAEVGLDLLADDLHAPLDIDAPGFLALEQAGAVLAFGLFTNAGELVGYAVGVLMKHQFTAQAVCSACGLFVRREHRRGGHGAKLMNALEEEAARYEGARVHWHAKQGSTFETVLRRRGARELETIFVSRERPSW